MKRKSRRRPEGDERRRRSPARDAIPESRQTAQEMTRLTQWRAWRRGFGGSDSGCRFKVGVRRPPRSTRGFVKWEAEFRGGNPWNRRPVDSLLIGREGRADRVVRLARALHRFDARHRLIAQIRMYRSDEPGPSAWSLTEPQNCAGSSCAIGRSQVRPG
jgi:hypothetical protein